MHVRLVTHTEDPETHIVRCARVSRRSEGKTPQEDQKLLRKLLKLGHLSPLEHAVATLEISGISRACADQLLRHRHISAVVESQRSVDLREASFIVPPSISQSPEALEIWRWACSVTREAYARLLELGVPLEDARFLIPMGVATRLVVTANLRAWRELLEKRLRPEAQWEIRALCKEVLRVLHDLAPTVFEDLWRAHGEGDRGTV